MFLVMEDGVQEQDGNAEYYLFPEDITFLAKNTRARIAFLDSLETTKILVESTERPEKRSVVLKDFINHSFSLHSRL